MPHGAGSTAQRTRTPGEHTLPATPAGQVPQVLELLRDLGETLHGYHDVGGIHGYGRNSYILLGWHKKTNIDLTLFRD
jgi:hypothetical protein